MASTYGNHLTNTDTGFQRQTKSVTFFICDMCNYVCNSLSNLKKHKRIHSGEKPYKCTACEYRACDPSNLKKHLIKRHINAPTISWNMVTSTMSVTLEPEPVLIQASNSHKPKHRRKDKPKHLKCSLCDYASSHEFDIRRHMRTHTGEKPFMCDVCDYRTLDKGNLTKHIRKHTGENPYSCPFCDYTCKDSSNLKKHIRRHTGEKPYQCNICTFRSACPANLRTHTRIHNNEEKSFACDVCHYKCMRANDLRRHMTTHGKVYTCKMCNFKSHDLRLLRKHSRIHVDGRCFLCNYKASSTSELKNHVKIHLIEVSPNSQSDSLADIELQSNKEMQKKCTLCGQKFTLEVLQTHLESHYGHYLENFKHFMDI